MPLYTGPDETSQVAHAAAVVRGQLIGAPVPGYHNPYTTVRVPDAFGDGEALVQCNQFLPDVPASCAAKVHVGSGEGAAGTYSGRYPPEYYALTGLPTLVSNSPDAVYGMRVVSSLLCAVFLGLAYAVIRTWSRRALLPAGLACALTPAALYTGAVVNPNGLEIAAAVCLWSAGLVLAIEYPTEPPRGLVVVIGVSGCVLALSRGLSPAWVLIILLVMLTLLGPRQAWALLRTRRDVQWVSAALLVAAGAATVWVFVAHTLWLVPAGPVVPPHATETHIIGEAFGQTFSWLQQMVGDLGWLDTTLPKATYVVWGLATAALALFSFWSGRVRTSIVLAVVVVTSFVLPVALELIDVHTVGLTWQGRYTLPLVVGIPLLAAMNAGTRVEHDQLERWGTRILLVLLALAGVGAYLEALRRYTVGADGAIAFWLHSAWQPVQGTVPAIAWYVIATALTVTLLWKSADAIRRRAGHPTELSQPSTSSAPE